MARRKMVGKTAPKGSQPQLQSTASGGSAAKATSTSTNSVISAGAVRTEERRKERQQEQRRQQLLIIGAVVGVIAVMAMIAIIVNTLPQEAPVAVDATTRYAAIEQGFNPQGYPRLGSPDTPIQVKAYSSFSCSACNIFHKEVMPRMIERVQAGEISFIFVPMPNFGDVGGVEAARSAMCVANQGQFWGFHDTLFEWQSLYSRQAFSLNRLRRGVEGFGLDLAQYDRCLGSAAIATLLDASEREGKALDGFPGTPAITVNGVLVGGSTLAAVDLAIDNALAQFGTLPNATPAESPTEVTTTQEAALTEDTPSTEEAAAVTTAEPTP